MVGIDGDLDEYVERFERRLGGGDYICWEEGIKSGKIERGKRWEEMGSLLRQEWP